MAALQCLPSPTLWNPQSKLNQHTNACLLPLLSRPRYIRLPGLHMNQLLAARPGCLTATARAKKTDHCADAGPSAYDRLLAASLYLWPICEGSWRHALAVQAENAGSCSLGCRKLTQCSVHRLAVVFARIVQYHALNWLIWINMHSVEVTASNDQVRSLGKSALSYHFQMSL